MISFKDLHAEPFLRSTPSSQGCEADNWVCAMGTLYQPDYVASGLAILIAFLSIPFIRKLVVTGSRNVKNLSQDGIKYEDDDGVASEDSTAQFSNKRQFIAIFIITLLAIAVSVADAIFTAVQHGFDFSRSATPLLGIILLVPAWVSRNALHILSLKLIFSRYFCFCNSQSLLEKLHRWRNSTLLS